MIMRLGNGMLMNCKTVARLLHVATGASLAICLSATLAAQENHKSKAPGSSPSRATRATVATS